MKTIKNRTRWALLALIGLVMGCEDFLNTRPYGTTRVQMLSDQIGGADALLIAAYSNLDGYSMPFYDPWLSAASNWTFGSVAGGDAYKGGEKLSEYPEIIQIETHSAIPANLYLEAKWITYFNGIARANDAIKAFKALDGIPEHDRRERLAEARFLRGYYHLELRKIFLHIPYLDETAEDTRIGNSEDVLPKIEEDFKYASTNLPLEQDQRGRVTKGAALSYLGISKMWEGKYDKAKIYFDSVIQSNRYHLNEKYHDNFNADVRNGPESILEVQQSVNDGSGGWNGNPGDALNYTWGGTAPLFCCGNHKPSQNLVNAFKTDASGLPLLDTFNDPGLDVTSDEGYLSSDSSFIPYNGTLDPRLDWTVGRRGIPYLDWGPHPGFDWIRNQGYSGPYSPIKTTIHKSQIADYTDQSSWSNFNANNLKLLRYADLLLYAAEAEVELGNLTAALGHVTQVRMRAANVAGFVKNADGTDAANYFIKQYPSFPDQTYARKAVRFERRLELGMEGHRFFDLVRWGIAAEEKNKYFDAEKSKRSYLATAHFEKGKNEILPIPQKAIDLSYKNGKPTLDQNFGY